MPTPFPSADGPPSKRQDETRSRNGRIAVTVLQHRFDRSVAVPFLCECSDERCEELIRLTLTEYDAARAASDYLVSPGHQVEDAEVVRVKDGVWLYRAAAAST